MPPGVSLPDRVCYLGLCPPARCAGEGWPELDASGSVGKAIEGRSSQPTDGSSQAIGGVVLPVPLVGLRPLSGLNPTISLPYLEVSVKAFGRFFCGKIGKR